MLTKAFFAGVCGQYGEKNNAGQDKIGRPGAEMLNLNTLWQVRIVRLYRHLNDEKRSVHLTNNCSGLPPPGAMVREAASAESPLDFVHNPGIAQKETAETQYWLELLLATKSLAEVEFQSI